MLQQIENFLLQNTYYITTKPCFLNISFFSLKNSNNFFTSSELFNIATEYITLSYEFSGNSSITIGFFILFLSGIVVSLPIVYQSINLAISSIEKEYIEEAILMGTNHFQMFRYIVFPMSKNGIIAGIILGMGRILGEFGATLMVAGNIPHKTQTIPTAIYSAVESGNDKEAMILILIAVWISSIIMWLYSLLKRKELKNQKNYPSYI